MLTGFKIQKNGYNSSIFTDVDLNLGVVVEIELQNIFRVPTDCGRLLLLTIWIQPCPLAKYFVFIGSILLKLSGNNY